MTDRELLEQAAKAAGIELGTAWYGSSKVLERFAALVEQRVRSEIALEKLADIHEELGGY